MMLRYIIIPVSILVLASCGSSPKEEDNYTLEAGSGQTEADADSMEKAKAEPAPVVVAPKAQEEARGLLSGISDAIRSGNDEAVARAASQVLVQNPNEPKALNALGVYHYKKGRFLAAQFFFTKALKVKSDSDVLNNLALVKFAQGEKKEAISTWKKALMENSNNAVAAANLGSVYIQEKDYIKASIALETAVKRGTKDAKTLVNYGIAMAATGSYDSAKLMYQDALRIAPSNQEARLNLAILYIHHLNQSQEGLKEIDRLRFGSPDETIRKRMIELENKAKSEIK